jgi:hypothetical protein
MMYCIAQQLEVPLKLLDKGHSVRTGSNVDRLETLSQIKSQASLYPFFDALRCWPKVERNAGSLGFFGSFHSKTGE